MALHPHFPADPYAPLLPDERWFPAAEELRTTAYEKLLPPLVAGKLSERLTEEQKDVKIKHLLQKLRRKGHIELTGGRTKAGIWRLKAS